MSGEFDDLKRDVEDACIYHFNHGTFATNCVNIRLYVEHMIKTLYPEYDIIDMELTERDELDYEINVRLSRPGKVEITFSIEPT